MRPSRSTFHGPEAQIHVHASTLDPVDALDAALASVRVETSLVGRSLVEAPWGLDFFANGDAIVSDGLKTYRGRPIAPVAVARDPLRVIARPDGA